MPLKVRLEFFRGFFARIDDFDSGQQGFDFASDEGIVRASEDEGFDVLELGKLFTKGRPYRFALDDAFFDEGNEFRNRDFVDRYGIV